jgi:phosphoribosylanthranilate isomerase
MKDGDRGPGTGDRGTTGQRVTVKICGLTSAADARAAAAAGADFLGFVFFPASRRCLDEQACAWIRGVSALPRVGVFRNQDLGLIRSVREQAALDLVQLHGEESPEICGELGGRERVIKAVAVSGGLDWGRVAAYAEVARVLFDTASPSGGGTGRAFDWTLLRGRPPGLDFWLAGGLRPATVAQAVAEVHPAGVDVASGVESSVGRKNPARMREFVAAVRVAEGSAG